MAVNVHSEPHHFDTGAYLLGQRINIHVLLEQNKVGKRVAQRLAAPFINKVACGFPPHPQANLSAASVAVNFE